jgi:hypothetical protein
MLLTQMSQAVEAEMIAPHRGVPRKPTQDGRPLRATADVGELSDFSLGSIIFVES